MPDRGRAIVEATSPRLLFETGLPIRYYLPKTHVRIDLPISSDTVTQCPYASTGRCGRRPASTTTSRGLTGPAAARESEGHRCEETRLHSETDVAVDD